MIDMPIGEKTVLQDDAVVACQGAEGAYSQMAANAIFSRPDIMYMRTFDGVFRAVAKGLCRYGVLPLENSSAGSVTAVYDLMKTYSFYIVRSAKVSVSHALLAKEKVDLKHLAEIYTHEQAARQCGAFLEENAHIKIIECGNTAAAARFVAESDRTDIAAIASENCGALYRLAVLARNVQNGKNNRTRFICISKDCQILEGADRISLTLTLKHEAGSLYEVVKRFADLGLNLTKLESRPIADTDFEFMFYFDFQASIEDERVYRLLLDLEKHVKNITFLGHYGEITVL